jgi:hypothetical protein
MQAPKMALRLLAAKTSQAVHEKNSLEMIDLMADYPRQETFRRQIERSSFEIERLDLDSGGTGHLLGEIRDRETTLDILVLALLPFERRIDQHVDGSFFFTDADVDDSKPDLHTDLGSGKTHARGLVHRLHHILRQMPELAVERFDRAAGHPQDRIGKESDR